MSVLLVGAMLLGLAVVVVVVVLVVTSIGGAAGSRVDAELPAWAGARGWRVADVTGLAFPPHLVATALQPTQCRHHVVGPSPASATGREASVQRWDAVYRPKTSPWHHQDRVDVVLVPSLPWLPSAAMADASENTYVLRYLPAPLARLRVLAAGRTLTWGFDEELSRRLLPLAAELRATHGWLVLGGGNVAVVGPAATTTEALDARVRVASAAAAALG